MAPEIQAKFRSGGSLADQTHEKESLGATEDAAGADTAPRETGRPATRAEEIAAALEDEIVQGELEPGRRRLVMGFSQSQ